MLTTDGGSRHNTATFVGQVVGQGPSNRASIVLRPGPVASPPRWSPPAPFHADAVALPLSGDPGARRGLAAEPSPGRLCEMSKGWLVAPTPAPSGEDDRGRVSLDHTPPTWPPVWPEGPRRLRIPGHGSGRRLGGCRRWNSPENRASRSTLRGRRSGTPTRSPDARTW